jgi:hypothetical protein
LLRTLTPHWITGPNRRMIYLLAGYANARHQNGIRLIDDLDAVREPEEPGIQKGASVQPEQA